MAAALNAEYIAFAMPNKNINSKCETVFLDRQRLFELPI